MTPSPAGNDGPAALTFDVDWAPDWCIDLCAGLCRAAGVPATFFATHRSDILADLARDPLFEIGIHPNFLPGSSHGATPQAVLSHCLTIAPQARAMRTHGLVQSSPLLALVADECPGIVTDVSLFLPFHPGLRPVRLHLGRSGRGIVRLPYFWEDDLAAADPSWNWSAEPPASEGLRIFDFHPIHVALNMDGMHRYSALKETAGITPLWALDEAEVRRYANPGLGTRTFLTRLIGAGGSGRFRTVSQIADGVPGAWP
ncbi:polysaccharide deacetylase WbmS family protein [Azospirillum sp. sgz302134]